MLTAWLLYPHWFWISLGGLLLAAEMLGASGYLLWSGIAAMLVGLLVWAVPMSWEWQGIIFALLTILCAWLWWYRLRAKNAALPPSTLNLRGEQLIGQRVTLAENSVDGYSRVRIGDSSWRVICDQPMQNGEQVEIYAVEGITLRVRSAL